MTAIYMTVWVREVMLLWKIHPMVIPCLVLLVIMLILIATLQHNLVEEYQEAVEMLDESNGYHEAVIESLRVENAVLRDSVSFSAQTLEEIDFDYIQTIPEGVDMRIQLVLQALEGSDK